MPDISASSFLNQVSVPQGVSTSASSTSSTTGQRMLGKDDFLKLLVAQMQNQDPMKPMDDSQTIAQMAQFSALEAMQNLNATLQQSSNVQTIFQAGALIGKYVQADQPDGTPVTGTVTGVDFTTTNGAVSPTLQVDGKDIDYTTIVKVSSKPIGTTAATSTSNSHD
jgi:flagellar basal-body rod modification protein FlgD